MTLVASPQAPSTHDAPQRGVDTSRARRLVEAVTFVAVWVAAGYLLRLSANGYLLLGVPLTAAFQLLVRRRPLRELFAGNTSRFALSRRGAVMAAGLAVVPGCYAYHASVAGDWTLLGWNLAAVVGAVAAAFSLRSRPHLRAHGAAGAPRCRTAPSRSADAGHRRLWGCRQLRRPDRESAGRAGHRRREHRQVGPGARAWCRPRRRLHRPGLRRRRSPVRLILDIGGNSTITRLRRALTSRGALVIVGGENGGNIAGGIDRQLRAVAVSPFLRQRLAMHTTKERASDLAPLSQFIETGQLVPTLERTYPLEHVPDALCQLESGAVRGKLAVAL